MPWLNNSARRESNSAPWRTRLRWKLTVVQRTLPTYPLVVPQLHRLMLLHRTRSVDVLAV
nr:MAG TPA: hypothetical protein [Caudoviricetes sp.]